MTTWPTAELHIHVEGTLEADLLIELARRNDVRLPSDDPGQPAPAPAPRRSRHQSGLL
jgi:adenosine deaminase